MLRREIRMVHNRFQKTVCKIKKRGKCWLTSPLGKCWLTSPLMLLDVYELDTRIPIAAEAAAIAVFVAAGHFCAEQ